MLSYWYVPFEFYLRACNKPSTAYGNAPKDAWRRKSDEAFSKFLLLRVSPNYREGLKNRGEGVIAFSNGALIHRSGVARPAGPVASDGRDGQAQTHGGKSCLPVFKGGRRMGMG